MDKINTDDLLVKILSFLPTKVVVTTSILSKRWKFHWMRVPKLETLPLHRVPVLERLRLELSSLPFQPEDIKLWVEVAVSLSVLELSIDYYSHQYKSATLPFCLYTCKSLETLALFDAILMVVPRMACLPSLKNLLLCGVRYVDESFQLLDVSRTVCFPSLETLFLKDVVFSDEKYLDRFLPIALILNIWSWNYMNMILWELLLLVIDCDHSPDVVEIVAPSLEYIKLNDHNNNKFLIENMPNLEEAYIDANIFECEKFLGAFTSVKRLNLCLINAPKIREQARNICTCKPYWSVILLRLLKGSPNLKVLEVDGDNNIPECFKAPLVCWDQVTPVPECLLTSLETFKWTGIPSRQEARDMRTVLILKDEMVKLLNDKIVRSERKESSSSTSLSSQITVFYVFPLRHHYISSTGSIVILGHALRSH
ncbi:hypothetical protein ARALYDRAFT_472168 [Arabidopsis lyrata subsp. lyrata]|uniref:Uncharacterized protein n=1 Tax=Arabidopsis lyrata subsp. lyrata TaxID=81972 RepID=D7KHD4_ARALL|nr:hypothetical protein ARALYDRAFT_472168 [Arabidopsis lyrata subsp. lyrata]